MQPYKHYCAPVIEAEIDESGTHCPADESTIRLWRKQFRDNRQQIESALHSLWQEQHARYGSLLSQDSLLQSIRNKGFGWLTSVTQFLLNANLGVPTQFAFCR
jgi:hypothetical protein